MVCRKTVLHQRNGFHIGVCLRQLQLKMIGIGPFVDVTVFGMHRDQLAIDGIRLLPRNERMFLFKHVLAHDAMQM